jgi:polyphosphate kinase
MNAQMRTDEARSSKASMGGAMIASLAPEAYAAGLARLQIEVARLQQWVVQTGARICLVVEGRAGAGKRELVGALTEHTAPEIFRVIALPEPTHREKSQVHFQRFAPYLPAAGEVVIFHRSWYRRVALERALGLCSEAEATHLLKIVPLVERAILDSGVLLLKYWLDISQAEQMRRLRERANDPRTTSAGTDLRSCGHWYEFSLARDAMFAATDTPAAPWFVARGDDNRRARLNLISHFLGQIQYEHVPRARVRLSKPAKSHGYCEPEYPYRYVEDRY